MAILAAFILLKLRLRKRDASRPSAISASKVVEDDFQKLVALVAFVFCCSRMTSAIVAEYILERVDEDQRVVRQTYFWSVFGTVLNSSVNIFVYLFASTTFRNGILSLGFDLCQNIRCCCFGEKSKQQSTTNTTEEESSLTQ